MDVMDPPTPPIPNHSDDDEVPPAAAAAAAATDAPAPPPSPSRGIRNRRLPRLEPLDMPIAYIPTNNRAKVPRKMYPDDGGFDLSTCESLIVDPHDVTTVSTGLQIQLPRNYVGLITPRASITTQLNLLVITGIVDSGYRGEITIMIYNLNRKQKVHVPANTELAQLVVVKIHSGTTMVTPALMSGHTNVKRVKWAF